MLLQKSLLFLPLSLSVNIKLICTRCETDQKSSQKAPFCYLFLKRVHINLILSDNVRIFIFTFKSIQN